MTDTKEDPTSIVVSTIIAIILSSFVGAWAIMILFGIMSPVLGIGTIGYWHSYGTFWVLRLVYSFSLPRKPTDETRNKMRKALGLKS